MRQYGVSVLELLIVMSIASLMITLLLPTLQKSREAARVISCANNLRQLTIAAEQFQYSNRFFPPNGGFDGTPRLEGNGSACVIGTNDFFGEVHTWGVGYPAVNPISQTGSWAYSLLPYLDHHIEFQQQKIGSAFPVYACVAKARALTSGTHHDKYGEYFSCGRQWTKSDYCANGYISPNYPNVVGISQITRGLANTIAFGEKSYDIDVHKAASWYWDEPIFIGGSNGTVRKGTVILQSGKLIPFQNNWGTSHSRQANFVFLDGSVRAFSIGTSQSVLLELLKGKEQD